VTAAETAECALAHLAAGFVEVVAEGSLRVLRRP